MATLIDMRHPYTGDTISVKVGWSWILFFWGGLWGIPWFKRKINTMGFAWVALWVFAIAGAVLVVATGKAEDSMAMNILKAVIFFVGWGLNIFGGLRGNEMTIQNYYDMGYQFTNPESEAVRFMNSRYHIFNPTEPTRNIVYQSDMSAVTPENANTTYQSGGTITSSARTDPMINQGAQAEPRRANHAIYANFSEASNGNSVFRILLGINTVLLGSLLLVVVMIFHNISREEIKTESAAPKFEYTAIFEKDENLESALELMGASGFEIVFARRAEGNDGDYGYEMILKKNIREDSTNHGK